MLTEPPEAPLPPVGPGRREGAGRSQCGRQGSGAGFGPGCGSLWGEEVRLQNESPKLADGVSVGREREGLRMTWGFSA